MGLLVKKKKQVAIEVWTCMWVLNSIQLIRVSNLKSRMEIPPTVLVLLGAFQDCFG